jgi:hypothetical protein
MAGAAAAIAAASGTGAATGGATGCSAGGRAAPFDRQGTGREFAGRAAGRDRALREPLGAEPRQGAGAAEAGTALRRRMDQRPVGPECRHRRASVVDEAADAFGEREPRRFGRHHQDGGRVIGERDTRAGAQHAPESGAETA